MFSSPAYSQSKQQPKLIQKQILPDTVKAGIYILSVFDLNFPGNQLNADFYFWYNYKNDSLKPAETFDLIDAKNFTKSGEVLEKHGDINYQTFRCNSVIKEDWDVMDFPFDSHIIEIEIEDVEKENNKLVFMPDIIGSKIDKNISIPGWEISNFKIRESEHSYETNYGDPSSKEKEHSTFSRLTASFTIKRQGSGLFFKLFIGLFISVLISLLTFFISPTDLDPRFGLPVGAIFAAIASQYVINSSLPQNAAITLVDKLYGISFIYIYFCVLLSTVSLYHYRRGREHISALIDKYSFYLIAASYVIFIVVFILVSVH
jgi:hypothetical protein